jgi:hypothetical protein
MPNQNVSSSVPQTTTNSQQISNMMQRKRVDQSKFHSQGVSNTLSGV